MNDTLKQHPKYAITQKEICIRTYPKAIWCENYPLLYEKKCTQNISRKKTTVQKCHSFAHSQMFARSLQDDESDHTQRSSNKSHPPSHLPPTAHIHKNPVTSHKGHDAPSEQLRTSNYINPISQRTCQVTQESSRNGVTNHKYFHNGIHEKVEIKFSESSEVHSIVHNLCVLHSDKQQQIHTLLDICYLTKTK